MKLNIRNPPDTLNLFCCFCDDEISKDQIISLDAWYECIKCDSKILTGPPANKGNNCSVKAWKSKIE